MLGLVVWFVLTACVGSLDEEYFTAAVFENRYAHDELSNTQTKDEILEANLRMYEKAAEVAASKGADIMVFSEYGLFSYKYVRSENKVYSEVVPDPKKVTAKPCNQTKDFRFSPILVTISCMAQRYGMYVVVNMLDRQSCDAVDNVCNDTSPPDDDRCQRCPYDGTFMYNTNVAFDREGTIIARYHKNYLWSENVDTPKPFEMVTFKTEFGTMGMVVCFDTVFKMSISLVEKHGVDTLIFPTFWYDDIFPLRSVEWQQAWALTEGVNVLAANGHHPDTGTVGSGIYTKDHGALVYTYSPDGESRVLVARVPRRDSSVPSNDSYRFVIDIDNMSVFEEWEQDGDEFPDYCYVQYVGPAPTFDHYRCNNSQFHDYSLKKLTAPKGRTKVCHRRLCCAVSYSADDMDEDYYLVAFNGTNNSEKGIYRWAEENCFLVRCDPLNGQPCEMIPKKARTVFRHIELRATFSDTAHVYPTVSKTKFRLGPISEYKVQKKGKAAVFTFDSNSDVPLLKAGLQARVHDRDEPFVVFEHLS